MSATDPTAGERPRCDTCSDTGRTPWMIEGDPNCYQEPDADCMLPCPDCTPAEPDTGAITDADLAEALDWLCRVHDADSSARRLRVVRQHLDEHAARLDAVRRKAGDERAEQIAQAIDQQKAIAEASRDIIQTPLPKNNFGQQAWAYGDAARIARESR